MLNPKDRDGEVITFLEPNDVNDVLRRTSRIVKEWNGKRSPPLALTVYELQNVVMVAYDEFVAAIAAE